MSCNIERGGRTRCPDPQSIIGIIPKEVGVVLGELCAVREDDRAGGVGNRVVGAAFSDWQDAR